MENPLLGAERMFDLTGKAALVTGGSRGIGRGIAVALARHGASVAVNYNRSEAQAEEVREEIESLGGTAITIQADVRDPAEAERLITTAVEKLGHLDILVNNAGFNRDNLILRMSMEDWDEVMDTNLRAVFICTKAALRPMMKQRWGRVINIGSVSGLGGNAGQANYAAAKSGLVGLTRAVAREMGSRNITSNLIAPGLVITELTKDIRQEIVDAVMRRLILTRYGKTEEIGAAVVFLASEEASYITGQIINVDGGLGL